MNKILFVSLVLFSIACNEAADSNQTNKKVTARKTIGTIEALDSSLSNLISKDALVEIIAEGHKWTEGPLWVESEKMLLFSDIPPNKIFKWTEEKGEELYLSPSGYTGSVPRGGEPGSNGLILNKDGKLVLCQHGDRKMAMMDAPLNAPAPKFITIADNYQGKKFCSPNDAVFRSNGDLFFTDPPYGMVSDSVRELNFQGVFKVSGDRVTLLVDSITKPNGIAFWNNEKTLIVACSDPDKAVWYLYDFDANDQLINERLLLDATPLSKAKLPGLPDGLKVDKNGNIFATGPGGVFIFNASGKQIGKINIPEPTSNIALADDDKTMYITANMYVLRVKMR